MTLDIYEDSLYGQIVPQEGSGDAEPGLVLLVDGEEEFVIEPNENGLFLTNYVERWITAQGIIMESEEELRIKIRNYTLEDEFDYAGDGDW